MKLSWLNRIIIEALKKKGVIHKLYHSPGERCQIFFLRKKKDGTQRAILNTKFLTKNVKKNHFETETVKNTVALMKHWNYFASIDSKAAYYFVKIGTEFKKFFRFIFQGGVHEFLVLTQG